MRRSLRLLPFAVGAPAALVTVLALAACASSGPPVRLYSLMPADLATTSAAVAARPSITIQLEPVRLPAQVDQPQWLVRLPDDSLASLEQERWASPLRDELHQALLEELAAHAGAVEARGPATGGAAPIRIGIDIRRFDSMPGREARLEGSWTLQAGNAGAVPIRCDWLLREPAAAGMPALATAHRKAVVRLADGIGDSVVAASQGGAVNCPRSDPR